MNHNCKTCRGGCCRWLRLTPRILREPTPDKLQWMEGRGTVIEGIWRIRSRCKHLSWRGRCKIYATRPDVCREYKVNGAACLALRDAVNKQGGGV